MAIAVESPFCCAWLHSTRGLVPIIHPVDAAHCGLHQNHGGNGFPG
jgi:hypothetical protein